MSDKPISKGDLVMVVKPAPCCGWSENLGYIFKVSRVARVVERCVCGKMFDVVIAYEGPQGGDDLARLKRLDPDALKDDAPTAEELTV